MTRRARAAQRALAYMMSSCPLQADKRFQAQFPTMSIPSDLRPRESGAQQTTRATTRTHVLFNRPCFAPFRAAIRDRSIIRAIDRLHLVSLILYFLARSGTDAIFPREGNLANAEGNANLKL